MSWIQQHDEAVATGDIAAHHGRLRQQRGQVANVLEGHGRRPSALVHPLGLSLGLLFGPGGLRRAWREMIAAMLSRSSGGDCCVAHRSNRQRHRRMQAAQRLLAMIAVVALAGCAHLFPVEAGDDLAYFDAQAPALGQPAPDIVAYRQDGTPLALSALLGRKPVVVQLGSHSCPVYRYRRFDLAKLQREFGNRVEFVVLYTVEAHPAGSKSPYRDGEWLTGINRLTGTRVDQPASLEARLRRAAWSRQRLQRQDRVLVDGMDDHGWRTYGAAPSAAFVIDAQGRIVLRQPWVEPRGIRAELQRLLAAAGQ